MKRTKIKTYKNASLTLASMLRQRTKKMAATAAVRAAGLQCEHDETVQKSSRVSVNISCVQKEFKSELDDVGADDQFVKLASGLYSAHITLASAAKLVKFKSISQIQTKKRSVLHMDSASVDAGLRKTTGGRAVSQTGKGVLVGIVDSGFDLSHPMFRDASGKLRVERLLDQTTGQDFTTAQLEAGWNGVANPDGPGADSNGHGTHVATISAGTAHSGFEGVAPEARLLLVKTNFVDTDEAVKWCFTKAGSKPCVVNLSLGNHWGGHDGTTAAEQLYETLSGRGKIIVASAGNERNDAIHIGGRFVTGQSESVSFNVLRQSGPNPDPPFLGLTFWYERDDNFDFTLVTPSGQRLSIPDIGNADAFGNSLVDIEVGHLFHAGPTPGKKVQITISFDSPSVSNSLLNGWALQATCDQAVIGRLDGWMHNSGFGVFHPGPLSEATRTIGIPATSNGCVAVASHVSSNQWDSDDGPQVDGAVLEGRISPFSSQGPTRDGRQKPEISAPGQYLTAGLAAHSELADWDERALTANRILSIEGTSMSAPVVTGTIALMLQKKANMTMAQAIDALADSAATDAHTGSVWNPAYGHGKLDVAGAISRI